MTEPTTPGVPATPVSADVPADEPAGPPPAAAGEPAGPETPAAAEPAADEPAADAAGDEPAADAAGDEPATPGDTGPAPADEPGDAQPVAAAEPGGPAAAAEPAPAGPDPGPEPVTPEVTPEPEPEPDTPRPDAPGPEPVTPEPEPAPVIPAPPPAPPVTPPTEPATPTTPEPVTPAPATPTPPPPAEPVTPDAPATADALALATAAATTTEFAPPAATGDGDGDGAVAEPEPDDVRRARRSGAVLGAAVAAVALLALGAFAYVGPLSGPRAEARLADRRADALAASRQLAINLVSIDYRHLDRDLKRISESTTGQARADFDERILSNEGYKDLVRENQAVLTSKIQRIGLEPCGTDDRECRRGDKAVVLVFLDQESRNKLRTTPRVDRNRVALTVVRQGGRWLVSEVKVL